MLGDMLFSVMRTLLALLGVCALAWVVLAALARRGIGVGRAAGGARLHVLERLALSPRRTLYLVRADERVFLVGAAEAGGLSLIAELDSNHARGAATSRAVTSANSPTES